MKSIKNQLELFRSRWTTKKEPTISFPIATYNRPEILIERTLPSILNQSYQNIEIVIVADHMKAEDYQLLKSTIIDKRVRIFNLNQRTKYPPDGFSIWCVAGYRPRNIAARICKGEWIWWISDDDILLENACRIVIDHIFETRKAEIVFGDYLYGNDEIGIEHYSLTSRPASLDFPMTGMPSLLMRKYLTKIFKWKGDTYKNKINKPSDYDLLSRIYKYNCNFEYLPKSLSQIIPCSQHDNLHGSKLYRSVPEVYL